MKKKICLLLTTLLCLSCSNSDNENETEFYIFCGCELAYADNTKTKNISCSFYAFPAGEYTSIRIDTSTYGGTAYAYKSNGDSIQNVGYCYFSANGSGYDKMMSRGASTGSAPILEGTYYIACFPTQIGKRFPYKAQTFTKTKDKMLFIIPVFTSDSYYGVDGYQKFEWDEL